MLYVISYDIEIDRIRNKIAKELENYGRRVQYSVFECDITPAQYSKLYKSLAKLMEEEKNGNIRFYYICKNCAGKIVTMGIEVEHSENEDVIII